MRTVVQRVTSAEVRVDGRVVGRIGPGVLLLVGVAKGDTVADADMTAARIARLRFFPGRTPMDQTLGQIGGGCLVVSQFTLQATLRKGNRPGFDRAAAPEEAEALYERVANNLREAGLEVAQGVFGAAMEVDFVNDGPVTFVLDVVDGRVQG